MQSSPFKTAAFFDVKLEMQNTKSLLQRVPEEHFGWKPHEKSFSLGELATHIANLGMWMLTTVADDGFDLTESPVPDQAAESHEELMEAFEKNTESFLSAFDDATDATLKEIWSLRHGDEVVFSAPKANVLRQWGISHLIHHRAQLTVYLRQLDIPLPPIYGPTADEQQ